MEVAKRAKEEIPFIKAYAAVKFSGEVIDSFSEEEINLSEILKNISEIVSKYLHIYKALGEYSVGIPKEILMSTTELFILVRVFYNEEVYQVAVLTSDANLGYTRYIMHKYLEEIA